MKRKDRVLFYAPHFAEYSARLAQALTAHADVLLLVDREDRKEICDEAWFRSATTKMRVIEFSVHRKFWRAFWTPILLIAGLLYRPNVVHVQEQADLTSSLVATTLSRWFPVVVTVHDPKPHSGRDSEFLQRGGQRHRDRIRAAASLFHVHGEFCRRELLALDATRPVIQTFHAMLHVPAPDEISEPVPNRVLFFGRMEAYKGLEVLLDAVDQLNERGRDISVVIAGQGEDLDRLRSRATSTRGVVVYDTFLTPPDVVAQFQKSAVVVLPYLDATQSGVAAAAIGNGRPMVSSAVGGLPDVIIDGENGVLVAPGDAMALANALDRILGDPILLKTLMSGARASQARLDWTVAAKVIVDGYRAIPSAAWSLA